MSENIIITTSAVPGNFCFTNWQESWSELVSLLSGTLEGDTNTFNFGYIQPSAENEDKPWLRTDSLGRPDKWYVFYAGRWVSPVIPYDTNERRIYVGTNDTNGLWKYDGGDGNDPTLVPPTEYTGAMWKVDSNMSARFPLGAGTLAPSGDVIAVTDQGGVDEVTLGANQLPEHKHLIPLDGTDPTGLIKDGLPGHNYTEDDINWHNVDVPNSMGETRNNITTADPVSLLPPYYGVYFIMRTARMYYTV